MLGPLSFIVAALIVYWSGWETVSWLLGLQIAMFFIYILCKLPSPARRADLAREVYSSLWLIGFYVLVIAASYLGTFGGTEVVGHPWDSLMVTCIALVIYYWGACSGLPSSMLELGTDDDD